MLKPFTVVVLAISVGACRTTHESTPANSTGIQVQVGSLAASWRVMDGAKLVGWLRRYVSEDSDKGYFFVVQNEFKQDLGLVDSHGRAWRSKAHQEEKEWLTTDTVLEGVRQILGLGPQIQLQELNSGVQVEKSSQDAEENDPGASPERV